MIKKITSKIKSLLGSKPSTTPEPEIVAPKKSKSASRQHKPYQKNKNKKSFSSTKHKKRETPEEYRKRHEQKSQQVEKVKNNKPRRTVSSEEWDSHVFKVEPVEGKTRFHDLSLSDKILHAVYDLKFEYCTEVQAETLQKSLNGDDVTAQAQTGTGKTAAFLITIFNHFLNNPIEKKRRRGTPRALILAPTRELVIQIEKDAYALGKYVDCAILSIYGGIDYMKQQNILRSEESDLLICTPGRLLDFMQKKLIDLSKVEILILDEADRMLDMGFIPAVKKIVLSTPQKSKRQTMFFTATMTSEVKRLADSWTRFAIDITVKPEEVAVDSVEQITYITTLDEKPTLLYNIITNKNLTRVLVFVNQRSDARKVKETFDNYGISCALLTGEVGQKQRISRLERFREGKVRVLVATDVASRGIHVESISHVINYNMPQDIEAYVHRIGRTGRAGASGISINFADEMESHQLLTLEEYLGKKIECVFPEEELLIPIPEKHLAQKIQPPRKRNYKRGHYSKKGPQQKRDQRKGRPKEK